MHQDWIYTSVGQRVLSYALDPRPVWFWNEDGSELVWRNLAAKLFRSKFKKKKGLTFLPDPVPLKGQVSRLVKLGHEGRASISRMRFQMGKKPVSTTCSCVPLSLRKGKLGLLVISTDSIDFSQFDGDAFALVADEQLFNPALTYAIVDESHEIVAGATADEDGDKFKSLLASSFETLSNACLLKVDLRADAALLVLDINALNADQTKIKETVIDAPSTDEAVLGDTDNDYAENQRLETTNDRNDISEPDSSVEIADTMSSIAASLSKDAGGQIPVVPEEQSSDADADIAETEDEGGAEKPPSALVELIDHLYTTPANIGVELVEESLPVDGDLLAQHTIEGTDGEDWDDLNVATQTPKAETDDSLTAVQEEMAALDDGNAEEDGDRATLWSISASHISRDVSAEEAAAIAEAGAQTDKTSKYNFDELSRILRERVNVGDESGKHNVTTSPIIPSSIADADPTPKTPKEMGKVVSMTTASAPSTQKKPTSLVALSDEALVLNKLPLGILIFKDQDILFANRAMADLTGHNTTGDLRDAGLDAILPRADDGDEGFGPVSKIIRVDEGEVEVSARLQTTVWQGTSAYMLTARQEDTKTDTNGILASSPDDTRSEIMKIASLLGAGFIQLNRAGYVLDIDEEGSRLFGPSVDLLRNRPILEYVSTGTRGTYLDLLSGKADSGRIKVFAGAQHCDLHIIGMDMDQNSGMLLGFLSVEHTEQAQIDNQKDELNKILPTLSREIRRPLATIAGFNSLMQGEAYGPIENDRYKEYVEDISKATKQVERVISEIDDLSRLNIGEMEIAANKIDLGLLLNKCIARIRSQANAQRVFVRSAIPETTYLVEADEKLLTQTIMNLLASAVTLTPVGGNVVLSAVHDDTGDLLIHVRDMGENGQDRHEQFIVYHASEDEDQQSGDLVRSGVGLSLTQALAKANEFSLSLDNFGKSGMLMKLAIPADRLTTTAG
ncbi:sensor histidine kinase [Maritalea sp.]|uniref:sensor histidine kinase n=1 Tax=Maritalea sp. TaxID=2003361 RepID=UPI003EF2E3C5